MNIEFEKLEGEKQNLLNEIETLREEYSDSKDKLNQSYQENDNLMKKQGEF